MSKKKREKVVRLRLNDKIANYREEFKVRIEEENVVILWKKWVIKNIPVGGMFGIFILGDIC